ncbi:hypothetical protein, partial [Candidatus Darwinibacter acetoxidans]
SKTEGCGFESCLPCHFYLRVYGKPAWQIWANGHETLSLVLFILRQTCLFNYTILGLRWL